MNETYYKSLIRDVVDFPEPGVVFKDITPLLADADALARVIEDLTERYAGDGVTKVAGIEARGFILASPVGHHLQAGFIPIRKPGKLPHNTEELSYELEYGSDTIEVHKDAFVEGDRVLLIDDVLATGGTAAAAARLIGKLGANLLGVGVLVELEFLDGRARLPGIALFSLVGYDRP